jgi:hypothetical protein
MENNDPKVEVLGSVAIEAIQRAEIDMQVATAHRYPRAAISVIKKKMLDFATIDEETAESCFYSLPRDGKTIQGPSVRLAEIAVACYGNLRAASRVISNDGRILTSQAACHDLENNNLVSVEVQRRITTKSGKTFSDDMVVTAGNAANSIAFRNAVFKVIPGAIYKPVYDAARQVAVGSASTLATKRVKVVARLNSMEVDTPRILARLQRPSVDDITLEDLEILIGAGTAIRDGDTTVDEAFPPVAKAGSVPVQQESSEQRAARLQRQMDEQAQQSEPKQEAKDEPETEKPALDNFWPDAGEMMAAFNRMVDALGADIVRANLAEKGINSDTDFGIADANTIAVYRALMQLVEKKNAPKTEPAKKAPITFGRKP